MTYHALDEATVVDYVLAVPALAKVLGGADAATATEVGDGNLNLVFIIRSDSDPADALVLKQALPYLRVAGDSWPLTRERMRFETRALRFYNDLVPDRAPMVHHADEEMSLVAMDFLFDHEVMRGPLIRGERFGNFATHISTFMARTHFFTSDAAMTGPDKKALVAEYLNPALCKIQEDFVYTNPYMESEENQWNPAFSDTVAEVRADGDLKVAIAEIKDTYVTRAQALLHGDLHTGSIMVTPDDTKVIDAEFAFFGPIGYDVGSLFANLVINHATHAVHTSDPDERESFRYYLLDTIAEIWTRYAATFDELWHTNNTGELVPETYWRFEGGDAAFASFRARYLTGILQDTAGHGGCEMLRRLMGIVTVPDLATIDDPETRAGVERTLARIARRWLLERAGMHNVTDLSEIVVEETNRTTS